MNLDNISLKLSEEKKEEIIENIILTLCLFYFKSGINFSLNTNKAQVAYLAGKL